MEVDDVIEEPDWLEHKLMETMIIGEELTSQELEIFEEDYFALHHTTTKKVPKKC